MVEPGQNLSPGGPDYQLPVIDHLVGLVGVGDQLGGVAAEEDHHYGGEEGGHGVVSPVVDRDGVMKDGGSENMIINCLQMIQQDRSFTENVSKTCTSLAALSS